MIRGIYAAGSGLEAASVNQDALAQNLANANMPGYRQTGVRFETFVQALYPIVQPQLGEGEVLGSRVAGIFHNFRPGPLQATGNPLDVALNGNGTHFFSLDGPNGPLYSRDGVFTLTAEGELQNIGGLPVRSVGGGRIQVPPGSRRITITTDGAVITELAEVAGGLIQNQVLGVLEVVQFADPAVLQQVGPSLFQSVGAAGEQLAPGQYQVRQGFREQSNVEVVNEMVSMILGLRYYEAAQRALRTMSEAISLNTRPQQ